MILKKHKISKIVLNTINIVLVYFFVGAIWIALSDAVLLYFVDDVDVLNQLQMLKGWVYILITSLLLYWLIKRQFTKINEIDDYNRILFNESKIGLALSRLNGELVDVNPAFAQIIGRNANDIMNLSYWDLTPDKYRDDEYRQLELLENTGKYGPYEKEYFHKDGHRVPVRLQGRIININKEKMIWSSVEDIGEINKDKKELENQKIFQDALLDCIAEGIAACDKNGKLTYFNQALREFHNLPPKPIPSEKWSEYYSLYEADGITPLATDRIPLVRALNDEKVENQEFVISPKNRSKRTLSATGQKLIDTTGNVLGAVVSMKDVSSHKRLEAEEYERHIRVSKYNKILTKLIKHPCFTNSDFTGLVEVITEELSAVLDVSRVSVWSLDKLEKSIICLNLWNTDKQEHSNGTVLKAEDFPSYFNVLVSDRVLVFDDVYNDSHTKEFVEKYFPEYGITSMLDAPFHFSGEIAGVICLEHVGPKRIWKVEEQAFIISIADLLSIVYESSNRKTLEAALHRAKKMDALGKLTGGIAHDYNNMLGVVIGYADLLEMALSDNDKLKSYVGAIKHAGERGSKLTGKLLAFARKEVSEVEVVDLNDLMLEQKHILEKTLTSRITLDFDLDKNIWPIRINDSDLEDAILNMSINAMHAITGVGNLSFKTANIMVDNATSHSLNIIPGEYVLLQIEDTGSGMDQLTQEKIFEPFYSTKGEEGTGLGLAQVYGFMERSNGAISVNSKVDKGTRFLMYFPRYKEEMNISNYSEESTSDIEYMGNENILIVDDEAALLQLSNELLTLKGYKVYCANSCNEALDLLENELIDLMISDIIMPDMDGFELASIVNKKYPQVKIQLVSGYSENVSNNELDERIIKNILSKPLTSSVLYKRVRDLLDS